MIERILVPLDGSRVGEAALPYVEDLANKLLPAVKVEVVFIQVLASHSYYVVAGEAAARMPFSDDELDQMKKKSMKYLRETSKPLKEKGIKTRNLVSFGNAAEEILKAAESVKADIIAMSSHGRSGISRWAFGSVTDRVLRGGSKPVLMVKAPKNE